MEKFERLLDENNTPTGGYIENIIGKKTFPLWTKLKKYLDHAYNIDPDLLFYGKRYGWCFKYRKVSRTLCTLFPERLAFTILITLGRKELEELKHLIPSLSNNCQKNLKAAKQFHDGKWYWMRVPEMGNVEDIKTILKVKRKPKL